MDAIKKYQRGDPLIGEEVESRVSPILNPPLPGYNINVILHFTNTDSRILHLIQLFKIRKKTGNLDEKELFFSTLNLLCFHTRFNKRVCVVRTFCLLEHQLAILLIDAAISLMLASFKQKELPKECKLALQVPFYSRTEQDIETVSFPTTWNQSIAKAIASWGNSKKVFVQIFSGLKLVPQFVEFPTNILDKIASRVWLDRWVDLRNELIL